jgi:hypothetical protein|tara:strand:- start:176 stop:283 length:108 start_codon:yes stop_codon:yes gene_type:complete
MKLTDHTFKKLFEAVQTPQKNENCILDIFSIMLKK